MFSIRRFPQQLFLMMPVVGLSELCSRCYSNLLQTKNTQKRVDHIYSCPPLVLLVKKQIWGLLNVWVINEIFMAMRLPHFWPCGSSVFLMCLTVMQKTYIMLAQIMTGIETRGWMALKRFACGPKSVRSLERHFSESVLFFYRRGPSYLPIHLFRFDRREPGHSLIHLFFFSFFLVLFSF